MGRLFLIVGPSASGKDTMIDYVTQRLPINKVKRFITRENNEHEDFESINEEEFNKQDFLISWEAHGNKYGIPLLNKGNHILNVSRKVVNEIKEKNPETIVIELTAEKEILKERMIKRGRDTPEEIKKRLKRKIKVNSDKVIDNSHSPASIAGEKLVNYLKNFITFK